MNLTLPRDDERADCTFGQFIDDDGTVECQTLEPPKNHPVPGRRRIPAGVFTCRLRYSPAHGHAVYGYVDVPGFSDVEIHAGNELLDTKACTVVGATRGKLAVNGQLLNAVLNSKPTLDAFMEARGCPEYKTLTSDSAVAAWIEEHPDAAEFTVTITDPPPAAA